LHAELHGAIEDSKKSYNACFTISSAAVDQTNASSSTWFIVFT
jgi:hypothetical protein